MKNLTIEQWMEQYPYLQKLSESVLFIPKSVYEKYQRDSKITAGRRDVSVTLLKNIITDSQYYDYVRKIFTDEVDEFKLMYIIGGDAAGGITLSRMDVVNGLESLIESKKLNTDFIKKYEDLKEYISFDNFIAKNINNNYDIEIDGVRYSIPVNSIIDFMQMSYTDFNLLCISTQIKEINNISKEHFVYAAVNYFKENKVFDKYILPETIINRFNEIQLSQKIDLEAINQMNVTQDSNLENVHVNDELRKVIFDGLPKNVSEVDKAIYIYIKMCKTLTYDDEFYAVDQKGEVADKHEDINNILNITPENNKVVCYEFNAIYGKLLDEIGIKYKVNQALYDGFGGGHASLAFRCDKFLVNADSVTSILNGDMLKAKLNQPLVGLNCKNKNNQTRYEFMQKVSKMYKMVASQEEKKENVMVEYKETFEDILSQYRKTVDDFPVISLDEKLDILIQKVNSKKMEGIDSLSYALQLRKILFSEEERNKNIGVTIIRNNETDDAEKTAMASAIFTLNKKDFASSDDNLHYFYDPNSELSLISSEELLAKFNEGLFSYVEEKDPRIPGLTEKGGFKK